MGIRIGVAGVGRLGRHHVRVLCEMDGVDYVACHDADPTRANEAADAFGAHAFDSLSAMFSEIDALDIVVPTTFHAEIANAALDAGLDVFVEKPIASSIAEGESMLARAVAADRILQVGHVERFNGVMDAVVPMIKNPEFIEVHRLAPFSVRGTDVSVVGDLMIHDLDLLSFLIGEDPVEIRASGASLLTNAPDIVNARIEYPGGCVANVTASRVTVTPMRKLRVFSPDGYVSVDLLNTRASCYRRAPGYDANIAKLKSGSSGHESLNLTDFVEVETITADRGEPLARELAAFRDAVVTRSVPPVTGQDGLNAVRLATEILDRIERKTS